MKIKEAILIAVSLLLYIGGTASAASPRESKIFTGGVPEDIFENSYQIGVLPSGNEVRKYRTDDGKSVYMIAHQSFQNKVKCYYLLAQDNLTGYLMFLNQLEKEFGSADDDTQFKEGGMDLGSEDLNRMLSNNEEFLVVNERLLPEAVFINIWRNPYLYYKQVSLTYHLDAHYDIPGTYVSDEGHVVFDIGYRNDLSSLRDILIKSMLSNGGINPDSFERLGTYSVPSIWGPDYPEEIRSILRYGTGESAKYYIQGTSRVINEKECDTYIWLKKENLEPFVNWLRTIHKEFVKSTSKKNKYFKKEPFKKFQHSGDFKIGGWIAGSFDVDMTVETGKSLETLPERLATIFYDDKKDECGLFIWFDDDAYWTFKTPDKLMELINVLDQ